MVLTRTFQRVVLAVVCISNMGYIDSLVCVFSVVVLQRSGRVGPGLRQSSGGSEAGPLRAAVLHRIHEQQLQFAGRRGGLDAGRPQQHADALPRCVLPGVRAVQVSRAAGHGSTVQSH